MSRETEPIEGELPYPASWEADVVLRDGHTVRIRPILPDDSDRLARFHQRQSPESVYFRYFSPRPRLSASDLEHLTNVDHHDRVAFVALLDEEVVGVARYECYRGTPTAEVAFFVDDEHHGRGLATVLLEFLVAAARYNGITRFTASTLPNNRKMLAVFAAAGFDVSSELSDGVVHIAFDIHPTDESMRLAEHRQRQAEAASVQHLLQPASVAVIGLDEETGLGAIVLSSVVDHGYRGRVLAVAPRVQVPEGVEVVGAVEQLPDAVDLAVIALPAEEVPEVVEACGERGVGAVAVLSAGFAERGLDGAVLQWQLVEAARRHGIRVLGPNCLGLVNTDPEVSLHATIAAGTPPAGRIAMMAESGTLAAAIVDHAERTQLGISTFVAAGNPADVGPSDMLSYWADDDATAAVLLYIRSSGLPPRLVRTIRRASLSKPVAVLGNVLVTVHGADRVGAQRRIRALTRQTGVIDVGTLEQLFDIGRLLSDQPAPSGRGVAVVGNSDGAVAIAADACRGSGLVVVDPIGPPGAAGDAPRVARTMFNPADLTMGATASDYEIAFGLVTSDPRVHSVIVVHTSLSQEPADDVGGAIVRASAASPDVCFAATLLGAEIAPRLTGDGDHGVPVFRFPEQAARAIGRLADYRRWRASFRSGATSEPEGCDHERAHNLVDAVMGRGLNEADPHGGELVELDLGEQEDLLGCYGVDIAEREVVGDVEEAVIAAQRVGWPVALKAARRDRTTRSAASGVVIDLADEEELRTAWDRVEGALGEAMLPAVVQRFIERGVDASVVLRRDDSGAATIEVGLGGPVTAFDEPQLGILPLTLGDSQALVASSALGRALTDPLDRVAIIGVVQRLAAMFDEIEEMTLLEVDPVVASVAGAWVTDARIVLQPSQSELQVRRLG